MNAVQRDRFAAVAAAVPAQALQPRQFGRASALARDYAFDLVRPGPRALRRHRRATRRRGISRRSPFREAEVVQRRTVRAGESIGYGATWTARADTEAAIVNIGYADGYLRCFAGGGRGVGRRRTSCR